MSNTTQTYLDLITSEYQESPNYLATVSLDVSVQVQVQSLLSQMISLFDLDIAVGQQLDFIGAWAGISRNVAIPITGIYFSWDDIQTDGWDFGSWEPFNGPSTITVLPDDAYRSLIRAKIAANQWDGTTNGAYEIWDAVFPTIKILIQDNQDMTYDLIIVGAIIDSLTVAIITGGYIPLKPEGVEVANYYVTVDSNPAFAWDVESPYLGGWDEGSWLREITPS